MTKKHFKWMAEYVAAYCNRKGIGNFRDTECYKAFVKLGSEYNSQFDIGKFDDYIQKRI